MKAIATSVICFLLLTAMTGLCPITIAATDFDESAARTGDLMTMLSIIALVAMAAFVIFIVVTRSKRNKNSHE